MNSGFVYNHDAEVAQWLADGVEGVEQFSPPYVAFGYVRDGRLVAAALFNEWNGSNIEISIRTEGAIRRDFMRACYVYCFEEIGATRVTAKVRRSNKHSAQVVSKLGFTFEATLKHYFGSFRRDDALVFRLLKSDQPKFMRS